MSKKTLSLALALASSLPVLAHAAGRADKTTCSVEVAAFDRHGRARPTHNVSGMAPAVIFRGRVEPRGDEAPLLFDVFNPRGQRYQVLLAAPRDAGERKERRFDQPSRVREATLAVAGSSIAWTSMYGKWRVEPRIEGQARPCGRAEYFTIRP